MGCAKGDLDFSHGLFAIFGSPENLGVLRGSWHFNDGKGNGGGSKGDHAWGPKKSDIYKKPPHDKSPNSTSKKQNQHFIAMSTFSGTVSSSDVASSQASTTSSEASSTASAQAVHASMTADAAGCLLGMARLQWKLAV